ncbi:uncharacterized protein ACBR49_000709 [Aulostomus maculatus]
MSAVKALQQWCRVQCDGYRDVSITNMTTSFRDGLAFCALIHKHRPELINFDSLKKENVYENNKLAFKVAEEQLGIPALLDAEDMVALKIPDRLSILTYVSQYYNYFHGRSPIGGMGGIKRPAEAPTDEPSGKKNQPVSSKVFPSSKPARENSPPLSSNATKPSPSPRQARDATQDVPVEKLHQTGTLSNKCVSCNKHVHLVQRHLVDGKLYHRNCAKLLTSSNTSTPLRDLPKNTILPKFAPQPAAAKTDTVTPNPTPSRLEPTWLSEKSSTPSSFSSAGSSLFPSRPAASVSSPAKENHTPVVSKPTESRTCDTTVSTSISTRPTAAPRNSTTVTKTLQSKLKFFANDKETTSKNVDTDKALYVTGKNLEAAAGQTVTVVVNVNGADRKQPNMNLDTGETAKAAVKGGKVKQDEAESSKTKAAAFFISKKLTEQSNNNNSKPAWSTVELKKTDRASQGQPPKTESRFEIPKKESRVEIPKKESRFEIPKKESRVEIPKMENSVEIPKKESRVKIPKMENSVEIPKKESRVEIPKKESRVEIPKMENSVEIPKKESRVEILKRESRFESPKREDRVEIPKRESRFESPKREDGVEIPKRESQFESPKREDGVEIPKRESRFESPKREDGVEIPKWESHFESPKREDRVEIPKKESRFESPKREDRVEIPKKESRFKSPKREDRVEIPKKECQVETPKKESQIETPKKETAGVQGRVRLKVNPSILADLQPPANADNQNSGLSPTSWSEPRARTPERGGAQPGSTPANTSASDESPADWRSRLKPVSKDTKPAGSSQSSTKPVNGAGNSQTADPSVRPSSTPRPPFPSISVTPPAPKGSLNGQRGPTVNDTKSNICKMKPDFIPKETIMKELQEIEDNLNELERRGVELEMRLRSSEEEGEDDSLMDELMVEWFNLIRNKQVAMRRESELVYIGKTQELEEEQPSVEQELRRLMEKPEHLKTVWDRKREEQLMAKLVEIVNDRNAIVEGLDEDRLREEEEDEQLNKMMMNFSMKKDKPKKKSPMSKLFSWGNKKEG